MGALSAEMMRPDDNDNTESRTKTATGALLKDARQTDSIALQEMKNEPSPFFLQFTEGKPVYKSTGAYSGNKPCEITNVTIEIIQRP